MKRKISTPAGLSELQKKVMFDCGTEPSFDNEYWNNHEEGIYVNRFSGEPLFSSTDKFDSGTGWPSFTKPVCRAAVGERTDLTHFMIRTEVRAASNGVHLGHVFDDGPGPEGKRYCINSASLRFVPAAEMDREGYREWLYLFPGHYLKAGLPVGTAILAGGCFWGVEAFYRRVPGVIGVEAGYTGGTAKDPSYREVCEGGTGHAEAVRVTFDPEAVSYAKILEKFWEAHDPTQKNRQGNDAGPQYRSAVFYLDEAQRLEAERQIAALNASGKYSRPAATEVTAAGEFYRAEEYHQNYLAKNPGGYCHVDLGKAGT